MSPFKQPHTHTHTHRETSSGRTQHTRGSQQPRRSATSLLGFDGKRTDGRTDRQCCQLIAQLGAAGKRCGNGGRVARSCGERDRERERDREKECVCVSFGASIFRTGRGLLQKWGMLFLDDERNHFRICLCVCFYMVNIDYGGTFRG